MYEKICNEAISYAVNDKKNYFYGFNAFQSIIVLVLLYFRAQFIWLRFYWLLSLSLSSFHDLPLSFSLPSSHHLQELVIRQSISWFLNYTFFRISLSFFCMTHSHRYHKHSFCVLRSKDPVSCTCGILRVWSVFEDWAVLKWKRIESTHFTWIYIIQCFDSGKIQQVFSASICGYTQITSYRDSILPIAHLQDACTHYNTLLRLPRFVVHRESKLCSNFMNSPLFRWYEIMHGIHSVQHSAWGQKKNKLKIYSNWNYSNFDSFHCFVPGNFTSIFTVSHALGMSSFKEGIAIFRGFEMKW